MESLRLLLPPYGIHTVVADREELLRLAACPGAFLCAHFSDAVSDRELEGWRQARRQTGSLPLVVALDSSSISSFARLFQSGHLKGVRALLCPEQDCRTQLNAAYSRMDLRSEVTAWLREVGVGARCMPYIQETFRYADPAMPLVDALQRIRWSKRTVRHHLQRCGLPSPSRWAAAARALRAAVSLQAARSSTVARLAHEDGFADHSALCQQLRRHFATTPTVVRTTIGWEWLLVRWLRAVAQAYPGLAGAELAQSSSTPQPGRRYPQG